MLKALWGHFGVTFWNHIGLMLGLLWGHVSDNVGLTWRFPWAKTIIFPSVVSTFLAGRFWASLGICGHPWGCIGAILGRLALFLGPSRGQLGPCWALLGSSLGIPGSRLEPSWPSYGPDLVPLGSSLGLLGAMLCHLDVSRELFGHPWSLPGAIWCHLGVPRVPYCASLGPS